MLEGLSKINWEKIRHRNGSASNVPLLIWHLISKVQKDQSSAIRELFNQIWYHGTVYEATARAVPFLYEVLESPICSERFGVLWLLASIASGGFRQNFLHEDRPEMVWDKNARMAVRHGVKIALRLLNDQDKDLRLPAILLLVAQPEEADRIKPLLLSLLFSEKNVDVRAGLGLALALLGSYQHEAFEGEVKKAPMALAKACLQNKKIAGFVCKTIQECFVETLNPKDQVWLRDERGLLDNLNLDYSYL